jgi:pimeloyl-ACP methyl ester carboxylesterase
MTMKHLSAILSLCFVALVACKGNNPSATTSSNNTNELEGRPRIEQPIRGGANALHLEPQGPAKRNFAEDFPQLFDWEWGFEIGGFGGKQSNLSPDHIPVIFVHGNTTDHADWYVVRDDFRNAGWGDQSLYGLSYNGLGTNTGNSSTRAQTERETEHAEMGWDNRSRSTNSDLNVEDLLDFILAVQQYTGQKCFSLVGHSLGVTVARKTLATYPELRPYLTAFVSIAGANHGTSLCPPGSNDAVVSCDEIAKSTPWLAELNGENGTDETYPPAKWLAVYDGSGVGDAAFYGPDYAQSPRLEGAENVEFARTDHNGLRVREDIVDHYLSFIESAEQQLGGIANDRCAEI